MENLKRNLTNEDALKIGQILGYIDNQVHIEFLSLVKYSK